MLIVISVLLSSIVIFLNLAMGDCIEKLIRTESTDIYGNYNISISSDHGNFNVKDIDWRTDKPIDQTNIMVTILYSTDGSAYKLNSLDCNNFINKNLIDIKYGSSTLSRNEVIVDEESAIDNDWNIGDAISTVSTSGTTAEYKIAGIAYNKGYFAQSFSLPVLVSDISDSTEIYGYGTNEATFIMCEFDNTVNSLANIKDEINKGNNSLQVTSLVDEDNIQTQVNTVKMVLIILLLLVIMLNYYIISSNANVVLESRTSVLATFRSIGATRIRIAFVILLENIVYGLIGGIVGCIIGYMLLKPVTNILVGASNSDWSIDIKKICIYILFTIVFSILVQVLCALRHVIKFCKKPIKVLLFENGETVYRGSKKNLYFGIIFLVLAIILLMPFF